MANKRIKYYSKSGYFNGFGIERIDSMEIPEYDKIDINDAIEYREIRQYFDEGLRLRSWTDAQYKSYNDKSKKLYGLTMHFFNSISDNNVINEFSKIDDHDYCRSFWKLFDICKLYLKVSSEVFSKLLHTEKVSLFDILRFERIANSFSRSKYCFL